MKRKFTLLFLCSLFALGLMAQERTALIIKASDVPVIDGVIDEVWAEADAENYIDRNVTDIIPTLGDPGETIWKGLWAQEGVYILLSVTDDDFHPYYEVPGSASWQYDKPELYFDVNFELKDGGGPSTGQGHYQVAPAFTEGLNDGTVFTCGWNGNDGDIVTYAAKVEEPNYVVEYFIPFSSLTDADGIGVDIEGTIGFDVTIVDRDEGDERERYGIWSNDTDTPDNGLSWVNMDDAGLITFDGAEGGIYVDNVSIEDAIVDENNGTVQIVATILPADATNKNLKWTVTDGTGRASIDKNGVLTGIVDGTVTVNALATDGSWMEDDCTVTISNQIVTMPEINLIRNGFFNDFNDEGVADEWSGNFSVVNGALYIPAPETSGNWWEGGAISGQADFGLNTTDTYTFSFVAWSESPDTFYVDFEDPANEYNRFGNSTHPYAFDLSGNEPPGEGSTQWEFVTNTESTYYLIEEDLVFERWKENTLEQFNLMGGKHDEGGVSIDSVILINNKDKDLLTPGYIPVTEINVSGGDAVEVGGTLQFSADVVPSNAMLKEVRWSVENGSGYATIDEDGMLTGDSTGMVTVIATAKDDSGETGVMDVRVGSVGISQQSVETLSVYPNPAMNELNVVLTSENTRVSIYNGVGQKLDEVVVSGTQYKFDISSYAAGIYFVKTDHAVARFVK